MKLLNQHRHSEKVTLKHKRRYCKVEGCGKIVKSQGVCQRHGAKPRKCRVTECTKQAQGNYDGMCKSHFRLSRAGGDWTRPGKESRNGPTPVRSIHTEGELYPYCHPVGRPDATDGVRQAPQEEEEATTVTASSSADGSQGQPGLWDEPLLSGNPSNNEELAADLFAFFPEAMRVVSYDDLTTGSSSAKKEEGLPSLHERIHSFSAGIPSCSDYAPEPVASSWDARDGSRSAFVMDYFNHENTSLSREAV